jgi:hypothetical protein
VTCTGDYPNRLLATFDLVEAGAYRASKQPSMLHWNDIVVFTVNDQNRSIGSRYRALMKSL